MLSPSSSPLMYTSGTSAGHFCTSGGGDGGDAGQFLLQDGGEADGRAGRARGDATGGRRHRRRRGADEGGDSPRAGGPAVGAGSAVDGGPGPATSEGAYGLEG